MPSYTRPGVYINEAPLVSQVPQITGTTQVAFVGTAPRGPLNRPTLIHSWSAYRASYGEPDQDHDLGFAVYHFFANGGANCWVHRVLTSDAVASGTATGVVPATTGNLFTATSKIRGSQANDLSLVLGAGTAADEFNLDVYHGTTRVETYANLDLDPASPDYVGTRIGHVVNGSDYITVTAIAALGTAFDFDPPVTVDLSGATDHAPVEASTRVAGLLSGGLPGVLFTLRARNLGAWGNGLRARISSGSVVGTATRFPTFSMVVSLDGQEVERWSELTVDPTESRYVETILNNYSTHLQVTDVTPNLVPWAAGDDSFEYTAGDYAFVGGSDGAAVTINDYAPALPLLNSIEGDVLINLPGVYHQTPINAALGYARDRGNGFVVIDPDPTKETTSDIIGAVNFATAPGYGAVYYPAAVMYDPTKTGPGALRLTAPGGAILGIYGRTDRQRSVAKAPAGYSADLKGVFALHRNFTETQIGDLYAANINTLRLLPGVGAVINGSRTLERTAPDMYIPIRRSLNFLKARLAEITAFAVFEPNDDRLWDTIRVRCGKELTDFWSRGGLKGKTPDQAFYVLCDGTNNTPASTAEGVVNVEVGLALQYPAEFIVINISQWSGGANTAEQ